MVAAAIFKNPKIVISRQRFDQSPLNLGLVTRFDTHDASHL